MLREEHVEDPPMFSETLKESEKIKYLPGSQAGEDHGTGLSFSALQAAAVIKPFGSSLLERSQLHRFVLPAEDRADLIDSYNLSREYVIDC